jgi:hypothetical protein
MTETPGPDYPAAHSMDTTWFAVDKDGHVGCFDSGEAGAVPLDALGVDEDVLGTLPDAVPPTDVIHDLEGRVVAGKEAGHHLPGPPAGSAGVIVFLDSAGPAKEDIAAGRAREAKARRGVAVIYETIADDVFRRLHEPGAAARCRGCFWHFGPIPDVEEAPDPAGLGLFAFEHMDAFENWISGLYGCARRPLRPVKIHELPPRLQKAIGSTRFEKLCFAERAQFQPIEHAECETWECAYVTDDGKRVRQVPGKDEEWASVGADTRDVAKEAGLVWDAPEPPPAPPRPGLPGGPAASPFSPSRRPRGLTPAGRYFLTALSIAGGAVLALLVRACVR